MKKAVWIVSALLAVGFLLTGLGKLLPPTGELETTASGIPVPLLRIAGAAEVVGAIGLILPAATRIAPLLTPVAASGLVITMIGAVTANMLVGEYGQAVVPALLGLLSAFVAWARFRAVAVTPRPVEAPVPG